MPTRQPHSLMQRHFFNPVGAGSFVEGTAEVAEGRAGSRKQGLAVQLQCRLRGREIREARFLAWGCPHGIAAASWLAETLASMSLEQAAEIRPLQIASALEVPADKLGSILILEDALAACLENARRRRYIWET